MNFSPASVSQPRFPASVCLFILYQGRVCTIYAAAHRARSDARTSSTSSFDINVSQVLAGDGPPPSATTFSTVGVNTNISVPPTGVMLVIVNDRSMQTWNRGPRLRRQQQEKASNTIISLQSFAHVVLGQHLQ